MQFAFFENARFVVVVSHLETPFFEIREPVLLLPAGSAPDAADPLRWNLPAGTVWLRAERLAAGAQGFAALRISGGIFNAGAVLPPPAPDGTLLVPVVAPWTLSVEPEPAPVADAAGSDGNALAIELPVRLELGNGVAPVISGALGLAGFGDALRFTTQAGATVIGGDAIAFPFDATGATWGIAGNRSPLFQAEGSAEVAAAVWSLPLSKAPLEQAGEAAHGGSVALLLRNGPALRVTGASGGCRAIDSVLSADASGLDWKLRRTETNLSIDVALWDPSTSRLQSGVKRIAGLRFASRRGGADLVELEGGRLHNRWNRPLAARDRPFDFDGTGDVTTLIAESDGLHRTAASASRDPDTDVVEGYALENLYLHLRPARRMAFVGSGAAPATLAEGRARLVFDVRFAQPMLPDPYASNWSVEHLDVRMAASALRADMAWSAGVEPTVHPRLLDAVSFPQQPPDAARDDAARNRFRGVLDAERTHLALLDLSGRDQQFGLAIESVPDTPLVIDADNRLVWPLRNVRLLMQPQVHWEPVHVLANDKVLAKDEVVFSTSHGGPTLVGATSLKLVPVLPGLVGDEIVAVANGQRRAAALFGLPFGMHAFASMEQRFEQDFGPLPILAMLHEPGFVDRPGEVFEAARQLRLIATGAGLPDGVANPSRTMPGVMTQTPNLRANANGLIERAEQGGRRGRRCDLRQPRAAAPRRPVGLRPQHLQSLAARAAATAGEGRHRSHPGTLRRARRAHVLRSDRAAVAAMDAAVPHGAHDHHRAAQLGRSDALRQRLEPDRGRRLQALREDRDRRRQGLPQHPQRAHHAAAADRSGRPVDVAGSALRRRPAPAARARQPGGRQAGADSRSRRLHPDHAGGRCRRER